MQDNKKTVSAPKNPQKQRDFFYVACDTVVYGSDHGDGLFQDLLLMGNGLLARKASMIGGITDEKMLEQLANNEGFYTLVHSIGITVDAEDVEQVTVEFRASDKKNFFGGSTLLSFECSCDGAEQNILLDEHKANDNEEAPGIFIFKFKEAGQSARVSIRFFLNDGYTAPNLSMDAPVDFMSSNYRRMIEKSLFHLGNGKRIQDVIKRAKSGEEVTVAYIGGSITEGAGAKPSKESYAYKSFTAFQKLCGEGSKVNYIKAGVGGTPSELGMIRYERDVLKENTMNPDIVIVEFAVNDADDETEGKCYESLVYRILASPNHPAVVLLFSVFANDWNLQERLSPVGFQYDLPMVSIKDAVVEQFSYTKENGNVITKRQFFYDVFHPTNEGHTIMADSLTYLFEQIEKAEPVKQDINLQQPPVIGRDFVDVHLYDRSNGCDCLEIKEGSFSSTDTDLHRVEYDASAVHTPVLPNNWMHTKENGNDPMSIRVKCKAFVLIYKDSGVEEFGKAVVSIDGKPFKNLDPHLVGWTHCHPTILINDEVADWHEITIGMEEGEEKKRFAVLGFGIV